MNIRKFKFIIWGAGFRAERILTFGCNDWIEAIVDTNASLWESKLNGIPIISPAKYERQYKSLPIIVTPTGYEESIEADLRSMGVFWYFRYWGKTGEDMEAMLLQLGRERIKRELESVKSVTVIGWSIITIILANNLEELNTSYNVYLPHGMSKGLKSYLEQEYKLPICNEIKADNLLFAEDVKIEDRVSLSGKEHINYSSITMNSELFYNQKLEQFKNIHIGERCFVVALGPSLSFKDLDTLHEHNEKCISMNRIFLGYDKTEWRPDYYIVSDYAAIKGKINDIPLLAKKAVFVSDLSWFEEDVRGKNFYKYHSYECFGEGKAKGFSEDFAKGSYWGRTINYDAVQLAVFLGFSEIYLIGADCDNYSGNPKDQHFVKNYDTHVLHLHTDEIINSFSLAKEYAEKNGIKIMNATRGGKLDTLDRVDFDSLF